MSDQFDLPKSAEGSARPAPTNIASLRGYDDKALVNHLLQQHKYISRVPQVGAGQKCPLPQDYVHELLKKDYASNPSVDIQVLAACIIADALRVVAPELPFAANKTVDALTLFVKTFERLRQGSQKKKDLPLTYIAHFAERLSVCHSMYALCKGLSDSTATHNVEEDLTTLVDTFLNHSKGSGVADEHLAVILNDVVTACGAITDQQFNLLIKAVIRKSEVARIVFNQQADKLQRALSTYVSEQWDRATEKLMEVDPNAEEGEDRKSVMKGIAEVLELVVEIAAVSPRCLSFVLPNLVHQLRTENNDLRLALTRGLGAIFHETALITDYSGAFNGFLNEFWDSRAAIRNEMLKVTHRILSSNKERDTALETLWRVFTGPLEAKLLDTEETVRKNAILVVMSQVSEVTPLTLLKAVGQRCRDKKPAIRTVAVQQLSSYYATLITRGPAVAWIPNDILHIYNLDDGTNQLAVEGALHTMIASSERFESFCGLLDDVSISIVQEIFSKMSRLRLVVAKLFSIRGAQEHRDVADKLIAFLQKNIPRGVGGEWLSILNVKETRVFKDFSTKSTQWDHMQEVAKWIKAQSKKEAGDYFEREVLWRITLPLSVTCVRDLGKTLRQRREDGDDYCGILKALILLGTYDSDMLVGTRDLLMEWVHQDTVEYTRNDGVMATTSVKRKKTSAAEKSPTRSAGGCNSKSLMLLFKVLNVAFKGSLDSAEATKQTIQSIGSFCMNVANSDTDLCKYAARCFCLCAKSNLKAVEQFLGAAADRLGDAKADECANVAISLREVILSYPEIFRKKSQAIFTLVQDVARKALRSTEVQSPLSLEALLRVMTTAVQSLGEDGEADATAAADFLIDVLKGTKENGSSTQVAISKRLTVYKQLIRLLRLPVARRMMLTNHKLMESMGILFSSEDNKDNRTALRNKLHQHLFVTSQLPLQLAGYLFLMALSEGDRGNLSKLRLQCRDVVGKYRQWISSQPAVSRVTLSDPRAPNEFPEYILPKMLLLLAHHPTYRAEAEHSYQSIQRVFALYFEEILRPNNDCASFIIEVIRKMKQHDDRYGRTLSNTRVLCDVASRVLQEILSQRSVPAEALRTFPGSIHLPSSFSPPADASAADADKVYLPADFSVIKIGFGGFGAAPGAAPIKREEDGERRGDESPPKRPKSDAPSAPRSAGGSVTPAQSRSKNKIQEIVQAKYGGLSEDALSKLNWKRLRTEIAEELGVKVLDEDTKKAVWDAIEMLQEMA